MAKSPTYDELEKRVTELETMQTCRDKKAKVFEAFADHSTEGLAIADLEGKLTYVNPALGRILGGDPHDFVGTNLRDYYPEEGMPNLEQEVLPAVEKEAPQKVEVPLISVQGRKTDVIQRVFLIDDEEGNPCYAHMITDITDRKQAEEKLIRHREQLEELVTDRTSDLREANEELQRDITERKHAEEALQEREARLRFSLDGSGDGTWEWDLRTSGVHLSERVKEMWEIDQNDWEFQRSDLVDLAHPDYIEYLDTTMEDIRKGTTESYRVEFPIKTRDGSWKWMLSRGKVITWTKDGKPERVFGTMSDITDRKQTEEKLRKLTHDLGERVKDLNCFYGISNLVEKPGISLEETIQGVVDLISPSWQYPEITCARVTCLNQEFRTKNFKQTIWKQASEIIVHGNRAGTLEVYYLEEKPASDEGPFLKEERNLLDAIARRLGKIIERKHAEEALQKAYDELELLVKERTAELEKTNEELKSEITDRKRAQESLRKSSEKIKFFAYSVCHDLKNPAIAAYGLTKLLHKQYEDILDEKGRGYCNQILRTSEQIAALVENINVYIQTKEAPLTTENVKLKEILQMVKEEFSAQLTIRQIEWSGPEQQVEMSVDRVAVLRALRNLVDNSLKYGGDGLSRITITYKDADEFHVLSVQDDGVGMRKEACEKIFEAFKRDETSTGIEGAGLGLAIVKEIAERHGGRVWVEPAHKRGITFQISISKYLL